MSDINEMNLAIKTFFNDFRELKIRFDANAIALNLIPLNYNMGKNNGVCTIIKKGVENKEYNQQDYPIILKFPGVMKIEQIYARKINNKNIYYLLIMEESLANLYHLNRSLHNDEGYLLLKILNHPFEDLVGENLLKFLVRQIINLYEFIDRNNFCITDLSLKKFYVSKKDFSLRLYNFKDILNFNDQENQTEKKSGKKSSSLNNKIKNIEEDFEIQRKENYLQIGRCIYDLIFGNSFFKDENENTNLFNSKKVELVMRYIKQIKAKKLDENIKNLLIELIDFEPKYRPNMEEIYRNKWIYQDYQIINDITSNFEKDIIKIISEFAKHDYLKKLESCYENYKSKDKNKINNENNIINNKINKKSKTIKTGRFTFKKKSKKNSFNF